MVYILNLILTVSYFYFIRKVKKFYLTFCIPILMIWIIILGGQYEVGTDYRNYLNFFYGLRDIELFYLQKEYLFYYFMKLTSNIFSNGQIIFIIIGGIESFIFFYFVKRCQKLHILDIKYVYIFVFLYLGYATVFYNQMNGLRQYFNIYLFSLITVFILEKKIIKYLLINLIMMFIHRSSYLLIPFYLLYHVAIKHMNNKKIYICLLFGSFALSLINILDILEMFVKKYVPIFSGYFFIGEIEEISLDKKIIKYIYLPFYLYSISLFDKKRGVKNEILKIGILSYAIRLSVLNISIVYRIGEYFWLLSIFPIYYLIIDWLEKRKKICIFIIITLMICIFIVKVTVLAKGEYLYKFYLFH